MKNRTETLEVGSRAPEFALAAANRDGKFVLSELVQRGTMIVEFLRGTWWPNCRKRLAQFELEKERFAAAGVQVVFVAAEKREGFFKPAKYLEEHPSSFPFLLDEDRSVTKAYGLYHRLGVDAINIAHPATLVVDRSGVIRYIYRGDNQMDRAPMEEVVGAVQKTG